MTRNECCRRRLSGAQDIDGIMRASKKRKCKKVYIGPEESQDMTTSKNLQECFNLENRFVKSCAETHWESQLKKLDGILAWERQQASEKSPHPGHCAWTPAEERKGR